MLPNHASCVMFKRMVFPIDLEKFSQKLGQCLRMISERKTAKKNAPDVGSIYSFYCVSELRFQTGEDGFGLGLARFELFELFAGVGDHLGGSAVDEFFV